VIPGISSFMKMFKTISVETHATKNSSQSANANALEKASKVLDKKGCVALFPQGNFSKLDQEPPRIYAGAARLALKNKVPINVYRLDGFWCLQNSLIPIFIRNNTYYRAFFSMLHMNKVRTTLCSVIDFHLQSENEHLSDDEKITAICAELYAYYRHTEELTDKQIGTIKTEISEKAHLLIWKNKVQQDDLAKQRLDLKKEEKELVQPTLELMKSMK
jgi:1-acyl-sn-glycerol-3-phosphate acyltransferase